jgi:hypothetical protein
LFAMMYTSTPVLFALATCYTSVCAGFMPYTKIAPERLRPGHKGDLSYLVGNKVRVRVVQVSRHLVTGDGLT